MEWGSSAGPQSQAGTKTWGTVTLVDPGTPTSELLWGKTAPSLWSLEHANLETV